MTAMTEERPIFENEEWLVTGDGLEHKTTGYFIERECLGQRRDDGLWSWPLHMAEKSWCSMTPFAEAFSCAASAYGVGSGGDLARTFQIARCEVSPWPHADQPAPPPAPAVPRTLRVQGTIPISMEPGIADKPLNTQGSQSPKESWRMRPRSGARPFTTYARLRPSHLTTVKDTAFPWRAPRRFRRTGTRLVRMIQAAWNIW